MKKITIGTKEYDLCEGVDDFYDIRFPMFLQYLRMSLEGIDKPLFAATMERAEARFDKGQFFKGFKEFQNYHAAINMEEVNDTGLSMCFALICLEDGEDQADVDEGKLRDKLARMRKSGLTRGIVEGSVKNFIKASPDSFQDYVVWLEMLEEMKKSL